MLHTDTSVLAADATGLGIVELLHVGPPRNQKSR